jgi:epsilon-lactone hydrolase
MDLKINEARSDFEMLGTKYEVAANIEIEKELIEKTTCYWINKKGSRSGRRVILYLHGGCYSLGSIDSHKAMVSHLAIETDSTFLFIEYSLAPEHVFPVAINEVLKVYNFLANEKKIPDISFMGDSAGPGLITSVVSILNREKNNNSLGCCIMISPWVDLRNTNDSIFNNKNIDPVLTKESLDLFASLYIGNNNLSVVNPIETFFGFFPPTLILVGTNEILLDDSNMIFSKISGGQPLTELKIYEDQTHVWLADDIHSGRSKKAIEEIKWFLSVSKT